MKITDCNINLWDVTDSNDAVHPWLLKEDSGATKVFRTDYFNQVDKKYTVEEYLKDCTELNVVKTVKMDANTTDGIKEACYAQALADKYGHPHGIVAAVDPSASDFVRQLEMLSEIPNVRAVRKILYYDPNQENCNWGGLPVINEKFCKQFKYLRNYPQFRWEIAMLSYGLPDATRLATLFPDIPMALGSLGSPQDLSLDGRKLWKKYLTDLSKCNNVVMKLTTIGFIFGHNWTVEQVKPWILDAIEIFGVNRCMFASGMPIQKMYNIGLVDTYRAYFDMVFDLTDAEKNLLFYENAVKWYNL